MMAMSSRSHSLVLRVVGAGGGGVLQARRQLGPRHHHRHRSMKAMKEFFTRRNTAASEQPPEQQCPPRTPVSASGWVGTSTPDSRDGPSHPPSVRPRAHKRHFTKNDGTAIAHRFIDVMHTLSEQLDSATTPAGGLLATATRKVHGAGSQPPGGSAIHLQMLEGLALGRDWHDPLQEARSHLLRYYRLLNLNEQAVEYDEQSVERAKAILSSDDAGSRVFTWITSASVRKAFENPYSSSP